MQFSVVSLVLLCAVSLALTAPAMKQDPGSELKDQMKNLQNHMASLGDQFKTVFQNVMKEQKFGKSNSVDKRGMESNNLEKNGEKDMREKLKDVSKQLAAMHEQLNSLRKKVYNMKKLLGGNSNNDDDDDDDDDFELDRREIKSPSKDANSPECIKKSIVQESDPFILRIALTIMKRINAKESRVYIEKLVNATADHLIAKMGATHGIKGFHKRLLKAVLQLLKVRAILTIKTEGEFIDKLDLRKSRPLETADKNVNQSKVMQALEEVLEGPLIKGFVSKVEEEKMIDSAVKSLEDAFDLSKNKTKSVIQKMISHVEEDIKAREHGKEQGKPMTDDEKIKGLEKMVVDKVKENKFNIKEMKYLVKGLAAAVGARNKLSASKTNKLENRILKGVQDYFSKLRLPENKEGKGVKQDTLKKVEELQGPASSGFNTTPSESHNVHKSTKETVDENIKKTLLDNLKELKKLASKLNSHSLPSLTGDTGDKVTIDAATNTRGSTKIVEEHNIKREHIEATKIAPTKSEVTELKGTSFDDLLNELQKLITTIKARVPSSKTRTHEKVFVDAAKGTSGERKIDAGFKRKRGLAAIVADAISLIKSLEKKQQKSTESTKTLATTKALQTTVPTKTLEPKVEPTKGTPSENVEAKEKKSEISVVMKAEIEKAEAEIQKELEEQQKAEEKEKLLAEEMNAGKKEKESQKEKQKQNEEQEREKQKQKEEEERERQKQKEEEERERQKQKEEAAMEKKQKNEKQKITVQQKKNHQGNKTKKNDIPGESKEQIEADEKEIEMEIEAQTNGKDKLIDKLQSLETKQKNNEKSKQTSKEENSELIKELDELFAKN